MEFILLYLCIYNIFYIFKKTKIHIISGCFLIFLNKEMSLLPRNRENEIGHRPENKQFLHPNLKHPRK